MNDNPLKSILKNIRFIMLEKDISQKEFGRRMNLSKQAISTFFSAEHEPRLGKLLDVARALEVEAFELLMSPDDRSRWKQAQEDRLRRLKEFADDDSAVLERARGHLERGQQKKVKKDEVG